MNNQHQEAIIYSSTPISVQSQLVTNENRQERQSFISSLIHSLIPNDPSKQNVLIESLRHQQQILGTNSKDIHHHSKQKRKRLSRRYNKLLRKNIEKIRRESAKLRSDSKKDDSYENYRFMNDLWLEYFSTTCRDAKTDDALLQRCLTVDLHGALIRVVRAKNESLINEEGIIIQETKNIFLIVSKRKNRRISVIKKGCLFALDVTMGDDRKETVLISGDSISVRPEQRGQKRSMSIEFMHDYC